jgi:alpha-beta hydrolase superfamily lysophospholipase
MEPAATGQIFSRDGTALYAEWFETDAPRALALIMHGYSEHCGRYREVAHVLANAGLPSLSFDMRGHAARPHATAGAQSSPSSCSLTATVASSRCAPSRTLSAPPGESPQPCSHRPFWP